MYFCTYCTYLLDIAKSSKMSSGSDTREPIAKIADAFNKLELGQNLAMYKAEFSKEDMIKNKKYQKLSETDKIKINQIFEEIASSGAEFKCNNCSLTKPIVETTLLYRIDMEDKVVNKISSLEENELTCKNPILPHTHDYTCKNQNCPTHSNPKLKDAVFIREKNTYNLQYICSVCFYNW
jgi:hypothetical protein